MLIGELLRVAWKAVTAQKLRSFLTLLGVIIGVMTVIAVVAVISGLNNYVATKIFSLSPDVYAVTRWGIITSREEFLAALKRKPVSKSEVEQVMRLARSAEKIGASSGTTRLARFEGRKLSDVQISGTTANMAEIRNLDLESGRFYTETENEHRAFAPSSGRTRKEELFRASTARAHVHPERDPVPGHRRPRETGSVLGQSQDTIVHPARDALQGVGRRPNINILVQAKGRRARGSWRPWTRVRSIFRALRHTEPKAPDPVSFVNADAVQVVWKAITAAAFALLVFISGISLVVGAIVIANIMLVSVIERTKEIGLRLAVGARKRDVLFQFLLAAAVLALGGGVLGVFFGWVIAICVDGFTPLPTLVTPGRRPGPVLATLTGVIAGVFLAIKARA